jgi:hypothetical protein
VIAYPGGRIIATTTLAAAVAFLSACASATNNRALPSGTGLATSPTHEQKFSYTGKPQQFKVPQNVSKVTVDALGARGAGTNGAGARVLATIPVTPGETLAVYVGGQGDAANGGYNGGASGGASTAGHGGFGGGGASDVRAAGDKLSDRILVAAGGGGGGSDSFVGASGGGGGGGSSYIEPSALTQHQWRGWKDATGDGVIVIRW